MEDEFPAPGPAGVQEEKAEGYYDGKLEPILDNKDEEGFVDAIAVRMEDEFPAPGPDAGKLGSPFPIRQVDHSPNQDLIAQANELYGPTSEELTDKAQQAVDKTKSVRETEPLQVAEDAKKGALDAVKKSVADGLSNLGKGLFDGVKEAGAAASDQQYIMGIKNPFNKKNSKVPEGQEAVQGPYVN